ncbi:hypothetical protein AYR57_02485 [Pediococcus claussenii]|nr:hypothetical protein AYR57_02485 [Pediococcus claussenii]ANZ71054.1 hypothetical protein AYR58_02500 [Pediococcus claussenii]
MQSSSWYSDTPEIIFHRNEIRKQLEGLLSLADNEQRMKEYRSFLPHVQPDFLLKLASILVLDIISQLEPIFMPIRKSYSVMRVLLRLDQIVKSDPGFLFIRQTTRSM